jgi:hypothetical protein
MISSHQSFSPTEQPTPPLYPPRQLPKSVKRKPRDNRTLLAAQTIEDHIVFSGFRQDSINTNEPRFRFRNLIGKQGIYQELDLTVTLSPQNCQQAFVTTSQHNTQSTHKSIEIASNTDLSFYGTAMVVFPPELRRFFFKIAQNTSAFNHQGSLARGMTLYRHYTSLGPFASLDKTIPIRYSHHYDVTKQQIFNDAIDYFIRSVPIQFTGRYEALYVNPPQNMAARAQKRKQREAAKLTKALQKSNDDDDDDDDDSSNTKKSKRKNTEAGSDDDGEEKEYQSDSDQTDDESEMDSDFGEVHDDDDDDYGGGASGDDEPTF